MIITTNFGPRHNRRPGSPLATDVTLLDVPKLLGVYQAETATKNEANSLLTNFNFKTSLV